MAHSKMGVCQMPIVYQVTNVVTGDRYIGHTVQRLSSRKGSHVYKAKTGQRTDRFHLALRRFGLSLFRYETLAEFDTWEETLEGEKRLIRLLRPEYNIRQNGESPGRRRPPEIPKRPAQSSLAGEEWRPVDGYEERYQVSSLGRIRSLDYSFQAPFSASLNSGSTIHLRGKILARSKNGSGTLWFTPGRGKTPLAVHVVVARAFLGPRPEGMNVLHKDDDHGNCRLDNLYYGTQKQNMADRARNGGFKGSRPHVLSLTQVAEIKALLIKGDSDRGIARAYNVTPRSIRLIRLGRSYKYVAS